MAGNNKKPRVSTNQGRGNAKEMTKLSQLCINSLNRLIDRTGTMVDWDNVIFRLHIGTFGLTHYFKDSSEAHAVLNRSFDAMVIVKLRYLLEGIMGLTMSEIRSIMDAFDVILKEQEKMTTSELMTMTRKVLKWYDVMSYTNNELANNWFKNNVMKDLQKEFESVKGQPVELQAA